MKTVQSDAGETKVQERRATLRVLIVDDLPEVRFLLEIALSREAKVGLVGQAEDGRQAVEKVELLRPELVIMDMQMPNMNGVEATRQIKEQFPQVEVVGFTSAASEGTHAELAAAGATCSFDKHQLKELLDLIRERAERR